VLLMLLFATSVARAQTDAPTRGPQEARSQIEVFLAFGDEASGRLAIVLETLIERHPADVHLVFRHATTDGAAAAWLPHLAALAAHRQGQFWAMAGLLVRNQDRHGRDDLIRMAQRLGLDVARFVADLDDVSAEEVLRADRDRAASIGITGPPAILINDGRYGGEPTLQQIEASLKR
jgi:predicted DsbA family dithiol-disulfide isomerase